MNLIEVLADYAHESWSGWMRYLFEISEFNDDGSVTIPKEYVSRWRRQLNTPYEFLSEEEKRSDRQEAWRVISIISEQFNIKGE